MENRLSCLYVNRRPRKTNNWGGGGYIQIIMFTDQWRSKLNNWGGGHIFIYSCSAQLISFEIDCFHGL